MSVLRHSSGVGLASVLRYLLVAAALVFVDELLETEKGKAALALIIRGADQLARTGANAPFLLRFIAQSIRNARAKGVGGFELNEWPDAKRQADGERGIIIDMKTRERVN